MISKKQTSTPWIESLTPMQRIRKNIDNMLFAMAVLLFAGVFLYIKFLIDFQQNIDDNNIEENAIDRIVMEVILDVDTFIHVSYSVESRSASEKEKNILLIKEKLTELGEHSATLRIASINASNRLNMLQYSSVLNVDGSVNKINAEALLSVSNAIKRDIVSAHMTSDREYYILAGFGKDLASKNLLALYLIGLILMGMIIILFIKKYKESNKAESKAIVCHDEAIKLKVALHEEKTVDQFTKLPNRLSMLMLDQDFNIALFDINKFSKIMGSYGKTISDKILLDFFSRISNYAFENSMTCYRYGADVAAIVGNQNRDIFIDAINTFYDELYFYFFKNSKHNLIPIRVSCGMATDVSHETISQVEDALASSKVLSSKKPAWQAIKPDDEANNTYRTLAQKVSKFWGALKNDEVLPHFQPIADATSLKIVKYEALARIKSGDIVVSPAGFLDGVYSFGLNHMLTESLLTQVWSAAADIHVSINLSISDIESETTCSTIFSLLKSDPARAARVTFEITESENDGGSFNIKEFIKNIRQLGSSISIDDFGTGYSNFTRITSEWEIDILKIDGSIISKIATDKKAFGILLGMVKMANAVGIKTIAEYVSSKEILDLVREAKVDFVQGYYIGKPIPFSDIRPHQTKTFDLVDIKDRAILRSS